MIRRIPQMLFRPMCCLAAQPFALSSPLYVPQRFHPVTSFDPGTHEPASHDHDHTLRSPRIYAAVLGVTLAATAIGVWGGLSLGPIAFAILMGAVILTGIPHGAVDHIVAARLYGLSSSWGDQARFYGFYLAMMAVYGGLWLVAPAWCLAAFLLMTMYHFGQADLAYWSLPPVAARVLYLSRGLLLVGLPIAAFPGVVDPIFDAIAGVQVSTWPYIATHGILVCSVLVAQHVLLLGTMRMLTPQKPEWMGARVHQHSGAVGTLRRRASARGLCHLLRSVAFPRTHSGTGSLLQPHGRTNLATGILPKGSAIHRHLVRRTRPSVRCDAVVRPARSNGSTAFHSDQRHDAPAHDYCGAALSTARNVRLGDGSPGSGVAHGSFKQKRALLSAAPLELSRVNYHACDSFRLTYRRLLPCRRTAASGRCQSRG